MTQGTKTLIIAEKPSVAREIAPLVGARGNKRGYIEGPNYIVSWAVGHLVGIAEPEEQNAEWAGRWAVEQLPMMPPKFKLQVIASTSDQFGVLQGLLHRDDVVDVVNATDAGREGELIFRRIYLVAESKKPVQRLWANDMTEEGLKKSLANLLPDADKRNLGLAAFARAEADWLVGMNYSRLFTVKTGNLVSVGRVQTPVLCILADRRRDVEHFVPQDFWTVEGTFTAKGKKAGTGARPQEDDDTKKEGFKGVWHRPPERKETRVESSQEADIIADACVGKEGLVESVEGKAGTLQAPLPFDLTTLQREANNRFGYSAKDTLATAQALYETRKLITYPRTDSRHLTKELFGEILKHFRAIHHLYPNETMLAVGRIKGTVGGKKVNFACVDDKKVTDHHAIIPTARKGNVESLTPQERNIYDMVCRRTIAAFCPAAKFSTSTMVILVGTHPFIAKGKVFKDKGWLVVEPWRTAEDAPLPSLKKGSAVVTDGIAPVKRQTKAPSHYTDASLLAAMETAGKLVEDDALRLAMKDRGLGTPATRAQTIETLISRGYVFKQGKKLIATDLGMRIAETVTTLLPEVASPELTGQWEKRLKDIEQGQDSYPLFMRSIRESVWHGVHAIKPRDLRPLLRSLAEKHNRPADGNCPLCGAKVVSNARGYQCSARGGNADEQSGASPNKSTDKSAGCPFMIWKTMSGATITEKIARELLEKGRTAEALDFTSKQGKPFKAHLTLEGGRASFEFVRSNGPWQNNAKPKEADTINIETSDSTTVACRPNNTTRTDQDQEKAHSDGAATE
ncbi:MAG: DNA topoisomerase 3 [Pseudomonadota bacterium]